MPRPLLATYRLQLTAEFPLDAARALVPYLHALGVSHAYLSPVLAARRGSTHGYDVVDFTRVNPELGTVEDLRALAHALHERDMGIVLDIVPNHMAASDQNPWWDNVLERGRTSAYANWFDVDWDAPRSHGKIVLPVLGDELDAVLARGELRVSVTATSVRLAYFDRTFPLDPATMPRELQLAAFDPAARPAVDEWSAGAEGAHRMRALLDAQHYRLVHWRRTPRDVNYRRFFDVNDLVALRMDRDDVFDAAHAVVLEWIRDGVIDGLRIDHVDGLPSPSWYLARLRQAVDERRPSTTSEQFPIYVEKILTGSEQLPQEWPVQGTTGYDFMNDVGDVLVNATGFRDIEAAYRALRRNPSLSFAGVAREGKRRALNGPLHADVLRVARAARAWRAELSIPDAAAAIVETIVHLDAYRTYVTEPGLLSDADRRLLESALAAARATPSASQQALDAIEHAFCDAPTPGNAERDEFVARFQQLSGPAAAKGVEDTALYAYIPLVSRNEVGGAPDRPLDEATRRLHEANSARARDWPMAMLATNSHDTKRSADVRARLNALTLIPGEWARHVFRWRRLNRAHKQTVHGKPAPSTNAEYLFYQTIVGIWPAPKPHRRADDLPDAEWRARARQRLRPYALKAAREAKLSTSWTDTDPEYERALDEWVRAVLQPASDRDAQFLPDVARLTAVIADDTARLALARVVLHLMSPGVPDIYQGDECWSFTLVDPDNRRPVDYESRMSLLHDARDPHVLRAAFDGAEPLTSHVVKLAVTTRLLHVLRSRAHFMRSAEYQPLWQKEPGILAFTRALGDEVCIVLVRTGTSSPEHAAGATVPHNLAGRFRSALTERELEVRAGAPWQTLVPEPQPVEVLLRIHG